MEKEELDWCQTIQDYARLIITSAEGVDKDKTLNMRISAVRMATSAVLVTTGRTNRSRSLWQDKLKHYWKATKKYQEKFLTAYPEKNSDILRNYTEKVNSYFAS